MRSAVHHWLLPFALLLSALAAASAARAQAVPESAMKAAFIFNFTVFTEWPAASLAPGAPIHLCASPRSELYGALSQLAERSANGHRIAVLPSASVRDCHVLYLDRLDRERWPQLRRDTQHVPLLTVTDDQEIGAAGAVISLAIDDERITFDVDSTSARASGLVLSSRLLRLARSVQ